MTTLREPCRLQTGREATPSADIIDSQSVKMTDRGGPHGYDGGKKVKGRKRHLLVDSNGLVRHVLVHEANIKDAQKVFNALHEKGLFILDEFAMAALQRIPEESITIETLGEDGFKINVASNKTQAELAESLKDVLEKMGFAHLRQSSVGGSIELEAFEGQIGYRVVLSPEGEVQVFKDGSRTDISQDTRDPIAAKAQGIQQTAQGEKRRKTSYMKSRKGQMLSH